MLGVFRSRISVRLHMQSVISFEVKPNKIWLLLLKFILNFWILSDLPKISELLDLPPLDTSHNSLLNKTDNSYTALVALVIQLHKPFP